MIPKTLIQSSRDRSTQPSKDIVDRLMHYTGPDWTYIHFTNDEMLAYLQSTAEDEFPGIAEQFMRIKHGAHKADLFRYYYLYKHGGVYIDTDVMLERDINYLVEHNDFFVGKSPGPKCWNGFIGSAANNSIIKACLQDALTIDVQLLVRRHSVFCERMFDIVSQFDAQEVKLLSELLFEDWAKAYDSPDHTNCVDPILTHYFRYKVIPII